MEIYITKWLGKRQKGIVTKNYGIEKIDKALSFKQKGKKIIGRVKDKIFPTNSRRLA